MADGPVTNTSNGSFDFSKTLANYFARLIGDGNPAAPSATEQLAAGTTTADRLRAEPTTAERLLGGDSATLYTVVAGDTLSGIAARAGVSTQALIDANPQISNPDLIFPGQNIRLPEAQSSISHTVRPGDTLYDIAQQYGVSLRDLIAANPQIGNPNLIHPGEVVTVPQAGGASPSPTPPSSSPTPPSPTQPAPAPQPAPGGPGNPAPDGNFDYNMIAGLKDNPNVTPAFLREVEAMAGRLGTKPEYILAVMSFETGGTFSPSIQNSIGATGLIQFIPGTARGLGTSTSELARMSSVEQLRYVEAYFSQPQYAGKLGTVEGLYSAVLSGTATPNAGDTLPNFVAGHRNYEQNKGLDFNHDGRVTSGEAASAVTSRLYGGVSAVQRQLVAAGAVPSAQQAGFVDGSFGPQTSAAIARFQQQQGLNATGLLDDATGRALFKLTGTAAPTSPANGGTDLQLSQSIHERRTPGRQFVSSSVIGDFTLTEGFMARGGPHSSKGATQAIFADNPSVAETVPAGVYNLGIDYVTSNGRIQTWFDGEVISAGASGGYGNRLIMRTDQTFTYNGREYPVYAHYAHADSFNVRPGDHITAGQDIGDQGSTGHSTGDHVDFHTWIEVNGARISISPNLLAGGNF